MGACIRTGRATKNPISSVQPFSLFALQVRIFPLDHPPTLVVFVFFISTQLNSNHTSRWWHQQIRFVDFDCDDDMGSDEIFNCRNSLFEPLCQYRKRESTVLPKFNKEVTGIAQLCYYINDVGLY